MFDFLTVSRALSDENRVRILMALRTQPMCVCQVTAFLDLAPSTTSKHLSILRQSRLIVGRKRGRWVYYTLAGADAPPAVLGALAWMHACLADESSIVADAARIEAVLAAEAACGLDAGDGHSHELHALAATDEAEPEEATESEEATDPSEISALPVSDVTLLTRKHVL